MSGVSDDVPDELKDAWSKLLGGQDASKLRKHLPALRQAITLVKGLEGSLRTTFEGVAPNAVDAGSRSEARTALVSSLQSHSLSLGGVMDIFSRLSGEGQTAVRAILDWIANQLVKLLTAFAAHLGLQSWSVGAELETFPPGGVFSITLTFA